MKLRLSAAAALSVVTVSACATRPPPPLPGQAFSASADAKPRVRQNKIVDLLSSGDVAPAKTEAQALVAEQPDDREAKTLLAEIEQDPKTLLGTLNFDVTFKAGDTFASLAEHYLRNRGLAYALARYNGLNPPNQPAVGQVIQIPGSPPRSDRAETDAPAKHREPVEPHAKPAPEKPAPEKPAPAKPAPAKPAPEKPAKPAADTPEKPAPAKPAPDKPAPPPQPAPPKPAPAPHDPAKAASLRSDALVLMNKGDIDHAVSLLRQATSLDPDSAPIKGDLDRALRIQHGSHGAP